MAGDPDDELLPEEDEGGEDDPWEVTSQELRRLRMLERQRQLAQHPGGASLQTEPSQEEGAQGEADSPQGLPPSSLPPWPTPRLDDAGGSEEEQTYPAPPPPPPLPSSPPTAATAPARRNTAPFTALPRYGSFPGRPGTARLAPMTGWQSFRRHAHWLIPALLVLIFFLLVLLTNTRQAGAMLFIFAAIGVLQSAILLYAPSDAFWAVGVVGGFLVFVSATFFVLFLPLFALVLSILLLSLGGVALRERYYPVKEGTVAVMGLFGRYNRTLQPGFNLRVPGEKVLGVVETQRIRYEARMPPITLFSGEQVTLSVAITYQVVPGEEHLAIRGTRDWQKPIQQQLPAVVQDVVSALTIDDFRPAGGAHPGGYSAYGADEIDDGQDASPLERINERLTAAMSEQVADRGVAVHAVKVHLLESLHLPGSAQAPAQPPPTPHPTVALPGMPQSAGGVVESAPPGTAIAGPPSPLAASANLAAQPGPPPYPPEPPVYPSGLPVYPPARADAPSAGAPAERMTLLSAEALAETYDAVVRQRITDPATIRRIISQFEAVAADPELSQQVPFDAEAGAQNLINHLRHLQARQSSPAQQPDGGAVSPSGMPEER